MQRLVRLLLVAAAALFVTVPADAVQPTGSAAWTTDGWTNFDGNVYAGPGTKYGTVGTVTAGIRVRVDRCSQLWCQIHVGRLRGWVSLDNVSFGQHPDGWFKGPKFPTKSGDGDICFFTGANYTGSEFCSHSGHVFKDLAFQGFDNAFSSAKIHGSANALVCRDRGFRSYCKTIDVDTPRFEGLLDNSITSIDVN